MSASVYETCRHGSGPEQEGENSSRRLNWCIKQRAFFYGHYKHHGIKALTASFPNGMSSVIGIISDRLRDSTMLTWSELDNAFYAKVAICLIITFMLAILFWEVGLASGLHAGVLYFSC